MKPIWIPKNWFRVEKEIFVAFSIQEQWFFRKHDDGKHFYSPEKGWIGVLKGNVADGDYWLNPRHFQNL